MNERGSAQWLILLLVLAVPGAMFFHWYTNLNAESKRKLNAKVRNRMPGGIFSTPPQGEEKLENPLAEQPAGVPNPNAVNTATASTDSVAGVQPSSGSVVSAGPDAGGGSMGSAQQVANDPLAALKALEAGMTIAQVATTAAAPFVGGVTIARDPTLSPYDIVRMEQIAFEKQLKAMEVANAGKEAKEANRRPKKAEPPIEDTIDLQGIVSTPDGGEKAIVNGEVIGEGEYVGQAKVLKITSTSVIFTHKGRRFSKAISR